MKEDLLKPKNYPFADARTYLEMDAEIKELDLWGAEFDQYISPFVLAIANGIDEATMNAVVNVGVTVNKEELLKALQYDRNQFAAGFKAGKKSAQPKWMSVEERLPVVGEVVLVRAKVKPHESVSHDALTFASYWNDECWVVDFLDDTDEIIVTHWMPLPSTEGLE